jgi:AraC family transcriptional regulator
VGRLAVEQFQRTAGVKREYFGGTLLRTYTRPGITVSEVEYTEMRHCRSHTHEQAFFSLLLEGSYREYFGGSELRYYPFSLGFHPTATEHVDEIAAVGTRFLLIQLSIECSQRMLEGEPGLRNARSPQLCNARGSWLATTLLDYPCDIESAVPEMLSTLFPDWAVTATRGRPGWLPRALDLLRSEYTGRLTVIDLAQRLDLHPVYLARQFRRWCGHSVGEFVNRLRVCRALEQLQRSEMPLAEIALHAGFADQSQFTKTFRRYHGTTPGSVRRAFAGNSRALRRA